LSGKWGRNPPPLLPVDNFVKKNFSLATLARFNRKIEMDEELYVMIERALTRNLGWSKYQVKRFMETGDDLDDWIDQDVKWNAQSTESDDGNHCRLRN